MDAWGIKTVPVEGSHEPCGLPAGLAHVRRRLEGPWMEEVWALQAATAREDG